MKKIYFITGATSGIGFEFTKKILKKKCKAICVGRNFKKLDNFVKKNKLLKYYIKKNLDLKNLKNLKKLGNVKTIDYFVNFAGSVNINLVKFFENKLFMETLNVNLISPLNMIGFFYANNVFNKNASIVLISSISGIKKGALGRLGYATSKSGIDGAIKTLALEMSEKNIRVNAIAPGMVETNILNKEKNISNKDIINEKNKYPLGKRFAKINEVNNLVEFLLSKRSSFITGQTIIIDGGHTVI